ncbi:zinc finger BED domain-containing protein 1-like [Sinocyclocheilus anshuiensis]|uniref:zinc finger BED domain-containing protein 1-like n=1 Tax=Sinocyclocheilus anshuiensis TaxID=1608454 RepID=UPI0007B955BB|nr:PREDICTED: zinc finger BED domain-containing protein 1-like [Sinocyclocheilus anshuiensis]
MRTRYVEDLCSQITATTSVDIEEASSKSEIRTLEYNYLLECTALDPRFRALPHLEKNQHEDVFHKLKEKAVLLQNQDEGEEGASGHPPATEEPLDQTDSTGAEQKQPPPKKTALEDLLGGFDEPAAAAQPINQIDAEMNKYRAETSISLNSYLLKWWKENARLYPLLFGLTLEVMPQVRSVSTAVRLLQTTITETSQTAEIQIDNTPVVNKAAVLPIAHELPCYIKAAGDTSNLYIQDFSSSYKSQREADTVG